MTPLAGKLTRIPRAGAPAFGSSASLRPIERVFLCLALTHSEALHDPHLCMEEWDRAMAALASKAWGVTNSWTLAWRGVGCRY